MCFIFYFKKRTISSVEIIRFGQHFETNLIIQVLIACDCRMLVNFDRSHDATRCLSKFLSVLAILNNTNATMMIISLNLKQKALKQTGRQIEKKIHFQLSSTGASLESTQLQVMESEGKCLLLNFVKNYFDRVSAIKCDPNVFIMVYFIGSMREWCVCIYADNRKHEIGH